MLRPVKYNKTCIFSKRHNTNMSLTGASVKFMDILLVIYDRDVFGQRFSMAAHSTTRDFSMKIRMRDFTEEKNIIEKSSKPRTRVSWGVCRGSLWCRPVKRSQLVQRVLMCGHTPLNIFEFEHILCTLNWDALSKFANAGRVWRPP